MREERFRAALLLPWSESAGFDPPAAERGISPRLQAGQRLGQRRSTGTGWLPMCVKFPGDQRERGPLSLLFLAGPCASTSLVVFLPVGFRRPRHRLIGGARQNQQR